MNAAILVFLLGLAPAAGAADKPDPFTAVRLAVEKADFNRIPEGKERALWETRLADIDARAQDLTTRIDSGALTRARRTELQGHLWETFRIGARIKRLLAGPRKPFRRSLEALPGLPPIRPLPAMRPLAGK